MKRLFRFFVIAGAAAVLLPTSVGAVAVGPTTASVMPLRFKNCTNYNKLYPHGVGRLKAVDKTSGEPVTNFKRSTALYLRAMSFNKGLDRDKDGIACEKA